MEPSIFSFFKSQHLSVRRLYVVPLIPGNFPETSYLARLYADPPPPDEVKITSLSAIGHFKLPFAALFYKDAVLHYHWLEFQTPISFLGIFWKLFHIILFNLLGGKMIWTIHNTKPHNGKWLKLHHIIQKYIAKITVFNLVHCPEAQNEVSAYLRVPKERFRVFKHPTFILRKISRQDAIHKLKEIYNLRISPEKTTFLCFGQIAPYKQIIPLCEYISNIQEEAELLIAGTPKAGTSALMSELEQYSKSSSNIMICSNFIPEKHVGWFFSASDAAVFNYKEILTSGAVELALGYKIPVLAPNKGCLRELSNQANVYLFNNKAELVQLLATFQKTEI